ncbi:hypothetical protein RHO12_01375 [Orbus sturtevantii]|uniref:hypothetical protein n=1 Tax=Orbus sturtevantii TaxID=3074109 RepID=UPI00370D8D03
MIKLIFSRLIITVLACFLLIGCIPPRVIITPDKLPDAIIGMPYSAEIKIDGGSGPIGGFENIIYPEHCGLKIIFPEVNGVVESNYMRIQGTPVVKQEISVSLKGFMIPTGWNDSSSYKKIYIIKVKEAEK